MAFRRTTHALVASFSLLMGACSSSGTTNDGNETGDGGSTSSGGSSGGGGNLGGAGQGGSGGLESGECATRAGVCELTECAPPLEEGLHAAPCDVLTFSSNPPTSGQHYSVWANFAIYDRPVPRGFTLHSLEHSAVVLSYNCDKAESVGLDCSELVQELTDFYDAWPADPLCTESRHRLLITPDPELDVPFAAAAWGHYIKGDCFDAGLVGDFIDAYYGKNYENFCNPGVDPFSSDYPADCGK